jgi:CDGSH-type Zn-finger protein
VDREDDFGELRKGLGDWQLFLSYVTLKAIHTPGGFMSQVTITVRPNGPLRVDDPNGVVEMVDADGNKYDLTGKTAFSLCRCGASANRPFCDGSHKTLVQPVSQPVKID